VRAAARDAASVTFPDINPYVPFLGPFQIGSFGPFGLRWYALA
jgi:hypothetical protein